MGNKGAVANTVEKPSEKPSPETVEELQSLLESLGDGSGLEVCVYEFTENGGKDLLRAFAFKEFDAFAFAAEYGGGKYFALIREINGKKYRGQKTFNVSKRIKPRVDSAGFLGHNAAPVVGAQSGSTDRTFELTATERFS